MVDNCASLEKVRARCTPEYGKGSRSSFDWHISTCDVDPVLSRDLNGPRQREMGKECFDFEVGHETGIDNWVHKMISQVPLGVGHLIVRQTVWSDDGCDTHLLLKSWLGFEKFPINIALVKGRNR
jgi:hypothetical protein